VWILESILKVGLGCFFYEICDLNFSAQQDAILLKEVLFSSIVLGNRKARQETQGFSVIIRKNPQK